MSDEKTKPDAPELGIETWDKGQGLDYEKLDQQLAKDRPTGTAAIYPALAAIMADISSVDKGRTNQEQRYQYRGIDDFCNALHPIFAKHGVLVLPELRTWDQETQQRGRNNTTFVCTRAWFWWRFMAKDGSSVVVPAGGESQDTGDKGLYKAQAMSLKYVLCHMFLVPTGDPQDDNEYDRAQDRGGYRPSPEPATPHSSREPSQAEPEKAMPPDLQKAAREAIKLAGGPEADWIKWASGGRVNRLGQLRPMEYEKLMEELSKRNSQSQVPPTEAAQGGAQ